MHNFFADDYRCTIGVDFQLKMLKFNDELEIRLQLWDIGGQERFSSMTRAYYKGAVGAAIVFDQVLNVGLQWSKFKQTNFFFYFFPFFFFFL